MSRKGNCLDNAATEQVFGHLKDEFYRGREFDSYERFKRELDAYIVHWNTRRRQIRLEGHTPEEFRSMSLAVPGCILINNVQQSGRSSLCMVTPLNDYLACFYGRNISRASARPFAVLRETAFSPPTI